MLIVNQKILNVNTKDPELVSFAKEYERGLADLKAKFPTGQVQIQRNGFPLINKSPDPNMQSMPETPSPIFIKLTKTDKEGNTWGYCKSRPKIKANGLASVPEIDNSEVLDGEILTFSLRDKPDYAFFILIKSGMLGVHYHVYDPEGDKVRDLEAKNAKLRVSFAIRENLSEEKLRMLASAWGVTDANKKNLLFVQEELETLVFNMEERKNKESSNLSLKGVAEFLAEAKNDEYTRPRAVVQYGIDEGKITFKKTDSHFYFGEIDLCYVPDHKRETRVEYLTNYLTEPSSADIWQYIIKSVIE